MLTKRSSLMMLFVMVMLSACATTPPTKFYTLSAQVSEPDEAAENIQKVIVGVGPVEVAPYLERNQIVTRTGQTRLTLTEFDHWAAPIEDNVANVLAINLSRLLPATQPIVRPWAGAEVKYHVLVKILRFDADASGKVQLDASWGIQLNREQSIPVIRDVTIVQPSSSEDYEAITRNMSLALARLSEQIAKELEILLN